MKTTKIIAILFFSFVSSVEAGEKVAIVTKIIGKAEYVRGKKSAQAIKRGLIVEIGDLITTKKGGFVALLFIDDKSALKIRERSQLTINGKKISKSISKKVNLTKGSVRAQVKEAKNFIVQTSVSVASVKGTDFWFISDTNTGDSIVGLEGIVTLTNRISGEKIDVKSGITGLSSKSGSLESFQTDPKNIPIDPSEGDQSEKQLEILFKNSAGEEKKLIIEYK